MPFRRSYNAATPPVTFSAAITVSVTSSAVEAVSSLASQTPPRPGQTRGPVAIAQRGLSDSAGPDDHDQSIGAELIGDQSEFGTASDELGRHRRQVSERRSLDRDRDGTSGAERCVVHQDLLLQLLQLRTRVEAELFCQSLTHPLVGRQCVGLSPASVQRGDQQDPQTLLVRVGDDCGLQLAHDVAVTKSQARRHLDLDELHARRVETNTVWYDPFSVPSAGEHLATEHLQRCGAQIGGRAVVAVLQKQCSVVRSWQHGERVDIGGVDVKHVPAISPDDYRRISEGRDAAW